MISKLGSTSPSFKANKLTSARDAYTSMMDNNLKIAQEQNDLVNNAPAASLKSQIPMQGQGKNLDVIA